MWRRKREVYIHVTSFTIPIEAWVEAKGTLVITPVVELRDGDITLSWSSDNTLYAVVSDNGIVSGKRPNVTTTIAAIGNGITRHCMAHVCYPVASVTFPDAISAISIGEVFQMKVNVNTTDLQSYFNKLVTFSSSNEGVVTVDQNGRVTGVSIGSAVITATSSSGITIIVRNTPS